MDVITFDGAEPAPVALVPPMVPGFAGTQSSPAMRLPPPIPLPVPSPVPSSSPALVLPLPATQ